MEVEEETRQRQDAIGALVDALKEKYNGTEKGTFYVNPDIEFVSLEKQGISVRATKPIPKASSILLLPTDENISISRSEQPAEIQTLLIDLEELYHSRQNSSVFHGTTLQHIDSWKEVALQVFLLLAMLGQMPEDSFVSKIVATWPSLSEFRHHCSIFELSTQTKELLRGTPLVEWMQSRKEGYKFVFEKVVCPLLEQSQITITSKEDTWETYLRACYVVRSRAHEGAATHRQPEIIPLLDQFNGLPESCNTQGRKCNIIMDRHFGRTHVFTNRDIEAGEELFLSYGHNSVRGFVSNYGFLPKEMVEQTAPEDEVYLHLPEFLRPPDDLRQSACQSLFPAMTSSSVFLLPSSAFQLYSAGMQQVTYALMYPQEGGTPDPDTFGKHYANIPVLGQLYQYLALCHIFTDEEVKSSMETQQIMGTETDLHISHLFQLLVDYTMDTATDLGSITTTEDLEKANCPNTPQDLVVAYRARVAQRDWLAQWRHAFCQRHGFPSQHAEDRYDQFLQGPYRPYLFVPNLPLPQAPSCLLASRGCRFCGSTLQLKACIQCKHTWYCSKGHQKRDWKVHKHLCKPRQVGDSKDSTE